MDLTLEEEERFMDHFLDGDIKTNFCSVAPPVSESCYESGDDDLCHRIKMEMLNFGYKARYSIEDPEFEIFCPCNVFYQDQIIEFTKMIINQILQRRNSERREK